VPLGGKFFFVRTPACNSVRVPDKRHLKLAAVCAVLLLHSVTAHAQNLGHKLPGLLGLEAGRIPEPGLYLIDLVASYQADELRDRNGNLVATGPFNFSATANSFGASYTTRLSSTAMFLTMTLSGPIARLKVNTANRPETDLDRMAMGDPYIQPIQLGWRKEHFDMVTSYGIYFPTDKSPLAGGAGVSSGQITHQFSAGGSRYFKDRTRFVTALTSYQLNMPQRGIRITRGDTLQIEGGAGTNLFGRVLETGVAGYALWQVRDDRGPDLPPILLGSRDRVYGLGPEAAVLIKPIRAEVRARFQWDMGVRARPEGHIFVVAIGFLVHRPKQPAP
jgi:hypothetical protein